MNVGIAFRACVLPADPSVDSGLNFYGTVKTIDCHFDSGAGKTLIPAGGGKNQKKLRCEEEVSNFREWHTMYA